ncbi:hypothetical protein [Streptomyces galbus]|uniref:Uncharacterized protein n=1 Tax=Streptomyces galbus TaxID=33898 RepID=A0A4U5WUX0_STRGB|nr:hypothetical protein [Streptomyces galbus]TKT06287.1 hypothetical protein E4U92_28675 [Streptomyces galbus]
MSLFRACWRQRLSGDAVHAVVRWLVAVASSVLAFFVVAVPWAMVSGGGKDPWEVIGPVAGVVAAGVLAAVGWWAAQAGAAPAGASPTRTVRQSARGQGNVTQTGGDRGGAAASRRVRRESVRQKARGGGDIDQVGGNRA